MFTLTFPNGDYGALRRHLLASAPREQAAFVYYSTSNLDGVLDVRSTEILTKKDFVAQRDDYLEITDDARNRVIGTAHNGGFGVVEFHSHPFDLPAQFSIADFNGLQDTVPHMLWRLKGRPYGAVVISPSDYDGLVWSRDEPARQLDLIIDMDGSHRPTGRSLHQWR